MATRTGIGGIVGQKRKVFLVALRGGFRRRQSHGALGEKPDVEAIVGTSRGRVETVSARPIVGADGWRAMFDLVPTDDSLDPVNLRLYLALDGRCAHRDVAVSVRSRGRPTQQVLDHDILRLSL